MSTNNKIVVISPSEKLVVRISRKSREAERDDPHDLYYSHRVSWLAGAVAPVVRPHEPYPVEIEDHILSRYPLMRSSPRLGDEDAGEIASLTSSLSNSLPHVQKGIDLRRLDIPRYVKERLQYILDHQAGSKEVEYLDGELERLNSKYPFQQLVESDPGLVHGDFKADNIVADGNDTLHAIDLDAAAVGPRCFDLAEWRFRCQMGDKAPLGKVVESQRGYDRWNEETFRALVGWKALSSLSFTLRYEGGEIQKRNIQNIITSGQALDGLRVV